jgi:heme/copper-type cytochrome/quinol oxidase subunit 3
MDQNLIAKNVELLIQWQEKRDRLHIEFLKQVLLATTSLTAILASLYPKDLTKCESIIYSLIITSNVLGILFLSIALYGFVELTMRAFGYIRENLQKLHEGQEIFYGTFFLEPEKQYLICEKIGYYCLIVGVFLILVYSVFLMKV